jgi:transposase
MKKYVVELTVEERKQLEKLINRGKVEGYKIQHAQVLLKTDQGQQGPAWKDEDIANAFGCHVTTVENIRRRFIEFGLKAALGRAKRGPNKRKLDGDAEAHLIAAVCSEAPAGRNRWTLRLLADRLVELGVVESVSHMTISRTLKKTNLSLG